MCGDVLSSLMTNLKKKKEEKFKSNVTTGTGAEGRPEGMIAHKICTFPSRRSLACT
jgi:hypothetical protein